MMNRNIVVKRIQNSAPKPAMEVVSLVATKCQNAKYECSIAAEENQQYCIKHILQDASAPYKQCTHIYLNGKQCTQAKPIEEKNDSK
jgi:Potential DNA-binding domain